MLVSELRHEPFNKTTHRRAITELLNQRSDGSIERKHQNVSAILIEFNYPYIFGYKPLGNYQALLAQVVSERIRTDYVLAAEVSRAVEAPVVATPIVDLINRWERPPEPGPPRSYRSLQENPRPVRPPVNYLEREARNASLGRAGEDFVISLERARLIHAGRESLADQVEHIALLDDGAGFDVRSFEADGRDRLIEVKTTAYGKHTPFFLSRNELAVSRELYRHFHLYRLFRFRTDPRLFGLQGALDTTCQLEPIQFSARVK